MITAVQSGGRELASGEHSHARVCTKSKCGHGHVNKEKEKLVLELPDFISSTITHYSTLSLHSRQLFAAIFVWYWTLKHHRDYTPLQKQQMEADGKRRFVWPNEDMATFLNT